MLQIVGALILLIAGFAILRLLFRALISTASALAGLILLCLFGPALLAGYITERITRLFHIRWLAGVFLTIAGMIISFMWGLDGKHIALEAHTFDSVKFILTTALAGGLLAVPLQIKNIQQNGITPEDISKEINGYYCCFYTAFFLMACSACAPLIALQYDISPSLMWWGGLLYWLAALVTLLWAASQIQALKKLTCAISQTLEEQPVLNSKSWLTSLQNDYSLPDSLTERIWLTLISQRISRGELREFELADGNWLLNNAWYERNMAGFNEQLKENLSFTPDELKTLFRNRLNLSPEANDDFLDRCLDGGDWYPFSEGRRFVSFHHVDELRICASCGLTEVHHAPENHKPDPEWYCSSLCRETETLCQEIYERPYNSFISDATANGLILMKLPETWSTNEKMFASGGQGHGFAAERGNHIVDRVRLKNARFLGDNNARNGADRLVSGTEIQTKYCSTAARSVGAAFDGQNGQYRYMGNHGPMQLEVPRDQYAGAVETMKNKIREGKVTGQHVPEIILLNSHDGTSSYQMLPGYFRAICTNGLVCGQSLGEVRVPHRGNVVDRVIEGAYEVVGVFDRIEEKRDAMQSLVLPPPARQALAQAALTYRYGDEHQPVTTADILTPRRREDYGKDLWSAYQTIQENMLKGGISGRSAKGKRIHTRAIHSIDTDIKLNRALWVMAETLLESLR